MEKPSMSKHMNKESYDKAKIEYNEFLQDKAKPSKQMNLYTFVYKSPRKTKLHKVTVYAESEKDALRQAPKEYQGCIMYGLVSVEPA